MTPRLYPSLLAAALALTSTSPARADLLQVPNQFGGIQDAINAAQPGDTVLVEGNGQIYGENLVMRAGVSVVGVGNPLPMVAADEGGIPTVSFPDPNTGRETLLSGLMLVNGTSPLGSGILLGSWASPTISGNVIDYQESHWGAGIFAWPNASPLIQKNTIRGCEASQGGGGIFLYAPGPGTEVVQNQIERNSAGSFGAGALLYGGATTLFLNRFEDNDSGGDGGGLWAYGTDLYAFMNDFEENEASPVSGKGGGAYLHSLVKPLLYGGAFRRNSAARGGGLYMESCTAEASAMEFSDNLAHQLGGGVFAGGWQGTVTLSACDLRRNVAGVEWWNGEGGGVFFDGAADLDVVNCVFHANSAGYGWNSGAGIRVRSADLVRVVNNTLVENLVNGFLNPGSGVAIGDVVDTRVTNNWFADHLTHVLRDDPATPVTLRTNLYTSNSLGQLVLDPSDGIALPLFVNPGVDFHVLPGDPGVDQGSFWLPGVPAVDMDGQARIAPLIDIGADELDPK